MEGWTIAILGTNTYAEPDVYSEVALSALSTTDPMADSNWLKVYIRGMGDIPENFDEPGDKIGGIATHQGAQKGMFTVEVYPFYFPADMKAFKDLFAALRKSHVYLYRGTYDFPSDNYSIHSDDKCLKVAAVATGENNYENGNKHVTIKIRKINPEPIS